MHKFMAASKMKDSDSFYRKYPTEEHFFADYSHMRPDVGQGVLPQIMPGVYPGNVPTLMNTQAKVPMDIDVPAYAHGGFYQRPGYFYDGNSMVKSKGATYDNGNFFEQGGYPHPLNMSFDNFQMGGYPHPLDVSFDEFKEGGIHINPANKGKFNALKKRTGKSTEELTHSSNPLTRKRAVFAQNAKHFKHEKGGYTGNDYDNPFHPIHRYMAEGGQVDVNGNPIGAWDMNPNPNSQETMQDIQAPVQQAQQDLTIMDDYNHQQAQKQAVSPQSPTNASSTQVSMDNDQYTDQSPQGQEGTTKQHRNGFANWGSAILGVGTGILGAASVYHDKLNGGKQQQQYMRGLNSSQNMPRYINSQSHGGVDQNGNMPYNTGYSQSPSFRTMEQGGQYTKNQVVDLSQEEINSLIKKGYKLQVVK